jgi:hypothetical protein
MEMSRRFFLGGAITLIAAQTFVPSVELMANIPTIYGDGNRDDSGGLSALFSNEPVTFNKEQIGVESHEGIVFHNGNYAVSRTIVIPDEAKIKIERATFIAKDLEPDQVFFWLNKNANEETYKTFNGNLGLIFEECKNHGKLIHVVEFDNSDGKYY